MSEQVKKDSNEEHKITRTEADNLKQRAIAFERRNFDKILVIPCSGNGGWYEIGNRSALFYRDVVCGKLGVNVSMMDDDDSFYHKFDLGRIRVKGEDIVRERLKKAELYKAETERDKCWIFQMNYKFTSAEIQKMYDQEVARQAEINDILKVDFMDAGLYQKMVEVSSKMHRMCIRKMDKISRDTNGRRMVERMDGLLLKYFKITKLDKSEPEKALKLWLAIHEQIEMIVFEMSLVANLKIWGRKDCVVVMEDLQELMKMVEADINRAKKKVEKKNGRAETARESKES